MSAARFPVHRNLAGFDFEHSCVERKRIAELADPAFTDEAHNVVLLGRPGTGRTPVAEAIALLAVNRGHKVIYREARQVTSNRDLDEWAKLLGDVVVAGPLIDRLMHHGHLLKFDGKNWRLKEAAARIAKGRSAA